MKKRGSSYTARRKAGNCPWKSKPENNLTKTGNDAGPNPDPRAATREETKTAISQNSEIVGVQNKLAENGSLNRGAGKALMPGERGVLDRRKTNVE